MTASIDSTHIVFRLEVSWNVQLMHPNGRARPASTLEWIEDPASPVISAGILLLRHRAVYLNHSVQHVLNMLFVGQRSKPNTKVPSGVACQHDTSARGIQPIAGITDTPNSWNVSDCGTAAKNWLLVVFPETGLKLERDLRLMRTGQDQEAKRRRALPCRQWCMAPQ